MDHREGAELLASRSMLSLEAQGPLDSPLQTALQNDFVFQSVEKWPDTRTRSAVNIHISSLFTPELC